MDIAKATRVSQAIMEADGSSTPPQLQPLAAHTQETDRGEQYNCVWTAPVCGPMAARASRRGYAPLCALAWVAPNARGITGRCYRKIGHATTLPGQKMVVVPRKLRWSMLTVPTYNQSPHMTEALGGSVADPEWTRLVSIPLPKDQHDSHLVSGNPERVPQRPEWIMEQTIDKESILKKKQREKREKLPVHYPGFTGKSTRGRINPGFIRGHMERYEPRSILGKDEADGRLGESTGL